MTDTTGTGTPLNYDVSDSSTPVPTTLTYNLASTEPAVVNRSRLRFILNDTTYQKGPKPDGENFTDLELDQLLQMENGAVGAAAALAFETLTAAWAAVAERIGLGPESYESGQARRYRELAVIYRARHGSSYGSANGTANIVSWADAFAAWYPHHP